MYDTDSIWCGVVWCGVWLWWLKDEMRSARRLFDESLFDVMLLSLGHYFIFTSDFEDLSNIHTPY